MNTFSTLLPPPCPSAADSHNLLGDTFFPYRQTILFNFPMVLPAPPPAQLKFSCRLVAAHKHIPYIYGIYSIYLIAYRYELSIMLLLLSWAKCWRRRHVAHTPRCPLPALNSLTISTIKMCQKIFQFPCALQRGGGRGRGLCSHSLHFSICIKFFWQYARATDLRQQKALPVTQWRQWRDAAPADALMDRSDVAALCRVASEAEVPVFNYLFSCLQHEKISVPFVVQLKYLYSVSSPLPPLSRSTSLQLFALLL